MVARFPKPEPTEPTAGPAAEQPPDEHAQEAKPRRRKRRRRRRRRKLPISVLPTLLTLGNVLCGFMAVFFASRPASVDLPFDWTPLTFAAMAVFAGMVFDGFDGRVARLTRSTSAFGEQLDSMADMVTFGVAPAYITVQLVGAGTPYVSESYDHLFGRATLVIALIYVACAALRLARYTVEVRDKPDANPNHFTGLPSPGAAGTIAALALLNQHVLHGDDPLTDAAWVSATARYAMVGVTLLAALAMVSKLAYTHVMNRYLRDNARIGTVAMYITVALLLLILPQWTLAFGFVGYAISAPTVWAWKKVKPSVYTQTAEHHPITDDVDQ